MKEGGQSLSAPPPSPRLDAQLRHRDPTPRAFPCKRLSLHIHVYIVLSTGIYIQCVYCVLPLYRYYRSPAAQPTRSTPSCTPPALRPTHRLRAWPIRRQLSHRCIRAPGDGSAPCKIPHVYITQRVSYRGHTRVAVISALIVAAKVSSSKTTCSANAWCPLPVRYTVCT